MFNRRLLVYPGGTSEPPLPTKETVLWKGSTENAFTITIPPGVKVLKITTENTYVNEFVDPNLPRYIGVTGGKTYNMRWVTVEEGNIPEPEYCREYDCRNKRRPFRSANRGWSFSVV